ncbi:hypothetical protein [Flavobacterium sp. F52]|uniref:hypothetical protein n=1 Tax=Flavobacterium sp. F52 TaxID=1202532 RepID=UPI0012FB4726|nr:hypothetical protein [Flavobacterium sp. F52]
MKKIYIIIIMAISLQAFSQNHQNFVFDFDKKTDEIVFRKNTKKQEISGFKILTNNRKVFFSSNSINDNSKLEINTTREQLNAILQNDNANQAYHFFVYLKDKNKYYSVDHIVRKISCE